MTAPWFMQPDWLFGLGDPTLAKDNAPPLNSLELDKYKPIPTCYHVFRRAHWAIHQSLTSLLIITLTRNRPPKKTRRSTWKYIKTKKGIGTIIHVNASTGTHSKYRLYISSRFTPETMKKRHVLLCKKIEFGPRRYFLLEEVEIDTEIDPKGHRR